MSYVASSVKNVTGISTGALTSDRLVLVTVNTGGAGAILKLYDGVDAATGTIFATVDASTPGSFTYLVRLHTHSLFYALSVAAADISITFD